MTDKEKLVNLFTEFGIEFEVTGSSEFTFVTITTGTNKVDGCVCFETEFRFNNNDQFMKVLIYE